MSADVKVMIAREEAKRRVDPAVPLADRFRAAFVATKDHWMATSQDDQYRAGVEAVYLSATEDEQQRILAELTSLRDLNALLEGVPVDIERITPLEDAIGIMRIFREVHGLTPEVDR